MANWVCGSLGAVRLVERILKMKRFVAAAVQVARIEPYGMFVVIGLMMTRTLGLFLAPFYAFGLAIVELVM